MKYSNQACVQQWGGIFCSMAGFRRPLIPLGQDIFELSASFVEQVHEKKVTPSLARRRTADGRGPAPHAACIRLCMSCLLHPVACLLLQIHSFASMHFFTKFVTTRPEFSPPDRFFHIWPAGENCSQRGENCDQVVNSLEGW